MNLFENLQIFNESENKLVSEFKEFLSNKNAQYIANEIGETKDGMQIVIYDGDWKHEHLYMKHLLDEFFTNKGIDISITSEEIGESDQDTFSARYDVIFNAKPKTYTADVKSLKFTTEDIEDSYNNDGLITELRTNIGPHNEKRFEVIQDGTLIFHSTDEELARAKFNEISKMVPKEYKKVDGKYKKFSNDGELASIWENVDTSNWKQRFKGMDVYVSDKYPDYQINKSYTSAKQEVWSVLDFKTQREVFASGTFEGAIKWIENKSNLKDGAITEVIEPSNFSPDGRSYHDDPDDWEEKHEWVTNKLETAGYKCKGKSHWKSIWTNGNPKEEITIDYWLDFDVIKEIVELSTNGLVENADTSKSNSFQIGEEYEWSGLYGGSYTGIVKDIEEDNITLDVSWTAEDTGKLVTKELTYDLETDSEGNIAFIVWRYSGEKGYVYPKNMSVTESIENDINLDDYEYVGPATGYNKGWSLYRRLVDGKGEWVAEHQQTKEVIPINYDQVQGFEPIKLDGVKKLQKDLGDMLLPKRESNDEDYDDNAATFLDTLEKEVKEAAHEFMLSVGFPEDEADDYLSVSTDINDDYVMVAVGAELGYDSLFNLCQTLDKVIAKHDEDAYFEPECPGRIVAYLFGEKVKKVHKEKEQALKDKIKSLDKVEETNHNIIEDKDYATGEEMYRELVMYLSSLDQVAMDGEDCNWEPSEFNAKNLNADGEIYLECGAYILIYPYINEWAEEYFKVVVVDAETCELSIQIKNGIERIFDKFKTDKWKLVFEG